MNELSSVIGAEIPVFAIMVAGLFLRRRGWLTADANACLMRICVNVLLPSLIFDSVARNPALLRAENLFLPPVLGFAMVAIGFAVAGLAARLVRLEDGRAGRTFAFTAGLQNYSYLTVPLCVMLFNPATTGVLFMHNMGVEVAMWTLGLAVLTGHGIAGSWRKAVNAPVVALLLAVVVNVFGAHVTPPAAFVFAGKMALATVHWLGTCAIPLALLLIGAIMADHCSEMAGRHAVRVIVPALVVRLGIMPVLFLLPAKLLPFSPEIKRILVLQGAMSSAVLPIVLTQHYEGDTRVAVQVVMGTSLVGILTIPMWIQWGGRWVGLW